MENNELPACPVETTLTLIGNKWKVLILRDLMPGSKRFGKLQRSIGKISQKVLTSNLKEMETKGIVHRKVYAEVPPRVEYSLTDLVKSLKPILDSTIRTTTGHFHRRSLTRLLRNISRHTKCLQEKNWPEK